VLEPADGESPPGCPVLLDRRAGDLFDKILRGAKPRRPSSEDRRPWNLWRSDSVRQKRSPGEIEIIDGAAFEDISWEYVAAITRNIDSN
jgi:hypothetical protein